MITFRIEKKLLGCFPSVVNSLNSRKKRKRQAENLQLEYRSQLALAKEAEDNIKAATHIRNLSKQEAMRDLFRRIKFIEKRTNNLATTKVVITTRNGQTKELFHQKAIEDAIMNENNKKFHQTEGFGQLQKGKLLQDIGFIGMGPKNKAILQGSYKPPPDTNAATKSFLYKMKQMQQGQQDVVPPVTFEDFCSGWKKAKEKTSSIGQHIGHYKTGMQRKNIARLLYQRSQIPMLTGYVPLRHRKGIDVMLLKKAQVYDVNKLRTIVLFDTEANMNNKHTGRRAMKAAIKQNLIADEQYSRPGRKSIDHSINRRLVMDHQLYRRQPYVLTSCDLQSCYDRINHTAAGLCLQKTRVAQSEITALLQTIQLMQHKVRTAFGDSINSYGGVHDKSKWKLPPQGVLQGNGAGPTIWTIISSVLFSILHDHNFHNNFTSAIKKIQLQLAGFAYVDDTDLIQIGDEIEESVRRMQQLINLWTSLIEVTGGRLAPEKCWTYMVDYIFKKGKWTTCHRQQEHALHIPITRNRQHRIKQVDTNTGSNMLGVVMSPNGDNGDHIKALRKKAQTWADNIRTMSRNVEEVWTAMHTTIPYSLCYSLPAVTLTQKECKYIMAPIHKDGLPRAGISSTIPSEIRNGPLDDGGLGVMDLFYHQGTSQVASLVSNMWAQNPTGKLLTVAMEDIAMEMGLHQTTGRWLKYGLTYSTTNSWIKHVLNFMEKNKIVIHNPILDLPAQRENDVTIMQCAIEWTTDSSTLRAINRVRMSLNIIWLTKTQYISLATTT